MKRRDLDAFQRASEAEIQTELQRLEKEVVETTMKLRMGELKNVHQPQLLRHDIARLITIKRHRQLAGKDVLKQQAEVIPVKKSTKKAQESVQEQLKTVPAKKTRGTTAKNTKSVKKDLK